MNPAGSDGLGHGWWIWVRPLWIDGEGTETWEGQLYPPSHESIGHVESLVQLHNICDKNTEPDRSFRCRP